MEVGEERLAAADERELLRLRLLHLDDEVGLPEHGGRAVHERRPGGGIGFVGEPRARPGPAFHDHGMPRADELLGPHGQEAHAVFVALRLPGHADDHETTGLVSDWILKLAGMGSE